MSVYGYAQTADLASLGLPASTLSGVTTTIQEDALVAASKLADSYLRAQFNLPLLSFGSELTEAVVSIAAWKILTRIGYNPALAGDDSAKQRHDLAIIWLQGVAKGTVIPELVESPDSPDPDNGPPGPSVFTDKANSWAMDREASDD